MNKNEHMKQAENFTGENCAYVHAEVKNGVTQLAVGGDVRAIIFACYRTMQRCEELSNMPFPMMLMALEDMYNEEEAKRNADERK